MTSPTQPTTSKRPWTSFSLRTLLIVMTLACCYFGYEVNVVRQRKLLIEDYRMRYGLIYFEVIPSMAIRNPPPTRSSTSRLARINFIRCWLGDHAIEEFRYAEELSENDHQRIRYWFPEAQLKRVRVMVSDTPG